MDYGVPPRYMLMANPALMELWGQAKCVGLGYLQLPRFKSLINVPGITFLFEDLEKGIRVFELLKSWDCEAGSANGTDISFIENAAKKSYTVAVGPNMEEMIKRLLDPSMLEDYTIVTMGITIGKTITMSQHFRWFQEQAKDKAVVFAPGNLHDSRLEHALVKNSVQFMDTNSMAKDTPEFSMATQTGRPTPKKWKPIPVDPDSIRDRRSKQLKRFFAVTTARLNYNRTFSESVVRLKEKYRPWQLIQAACNILCNQRFAELREKNAKLDFHKAYDVIRQTPEAIADGIALEHVFSEVSFEEQIAEDLKYLAQQVQANPPTAATLRKLGLLG
jgi:hypothetical protein